MKLAAIFTMTFLYLCSAYGELSVEKKGESIITENALEWTDSRYGNLYMNSLSFQQDALITYNGYQYAAFYSANRYVAVSRRELPSGTWESFELTDYKQNTNDNHNTISMGISPSDGRIHLSFDHHTVPINYRISREGIATNPQSFEWNQALFNNVTNRLDGETVRDVTYPRFITAPDSTLVLIVRTGTSGSSDNRIWKYNNDGTWKNLGQFIEGDYSEGTCTAYFHGLRFDNNNRLHAAWCWRETGSGGMNHDLMYAYSDDYGKKWHDNNGNIVAESGRQYISQNTASCKIWTIPTNTGLINQESMTIDSRGRVHVLSREDVSGKNMQLHYFRDTLGEWHRGNTGIQTKIWDNRSGIACDAEDNVYAVMPHISIAGASLNSGYSDWRILDKQDENRFYYSEPLVSVKDNDEKRSSLYVFAQEGLSEIKNWRNVSNVLIGPEVMGVERNGYCESNSDKWTGFNLNFDLKIRETAAGVCFRVKDSDNFYMWQFNADSDLLRFHIRNRGEWSVHKETNYNLQTGTKYQVEIEVSQSNYKCLINGQEIDSYSDNSFNDGVVGFRSGLHESFTVDNLSVSDNQILFSDSFDYSASLTSPVIRCLEYELNAEPAFVKKTGQHKRTDFAVKARIEKNRLVCNLERTSDVSGSIFDINGKLVKNIENKNVSSGRYSMDLNEYLTVSGIYLVFIRVNGVISGRTAVSACR